MLVSAGWLKDYARTKASVHDIAERLTMQLNEVDEVRSLKGLAKVVVGEVTALKRHRNADKLWTVEVTAGRSTYDLVAGADNLFVGAKVPLAKVGVTLPDGLKIAKRTFRGEVSEGMLCSARELGFGEDHSGVWILPADAPSGQPLDKALAGRRDTFDLDVPANRGDCMGHLGVAREVAAGFGAAFQEPKLKTSPRAKKGALTAKSTDKNQCARFSLARIRGLQNRESPDWLKERLISVGLRPISAVVDVTNFVMLETGQPLHAYDATKLTGVMLYARPSRSEESVKTLDGKTHKLPKGTLVIADRTQALGIAGIMGGASSEVAKQTDDIVLECANFDPTTVRRASRALGIRTDASARFEKGLAPELTWPAIRRAIDLILEICGGELVQLTDDYPKKQKQPTLQLDPATLSSFLGKSMPLPAIKKSLGALGFTVKSGKKLAVTPPYWRPDIQEESDLFEEAIRLAGYEQVPSTLPSGQLTVPTVPALHGLSDSLRTTLAGLGLTEILTHSLVGTDLLTKSGYPTDLVPMANPLSEDHAYLRGSLGPRHLEAVADNLRWRDELRLFEIGRVFKPTGKGKRPQEKTTALITFATKHRTLPFGEIRGILEQVAEALHLDPTLLKFNVQELAQFSQYFQITYKRIDIGAIGQYRHAKRFKAETILGLSFNLDRLATALPEHWSVENPPAFPPALRDLSWFIPDGVTYASVRELIEKKGGDLIRSVGDAEEYRKDGKRSIKVRISLGAPDRTLKDAEVNQVVESIVAAGREQGWKIR